MSTKEEQNINLKSIDDVYKLILNVNKNISSKIEALENNVKEIAKKVDLEVVALKEKVQNLEKENADLQKEVITIKRNIKRNNIVIYGIQEDTGENVQEKVLQLITGQLAVQINRFEIKNIQRLGKVTEKSRPILIEFLTYFRKKEILYNRRNLKGTSIYIAEDLIYEDREERKILVKQLKLARSKNQSAKLIGNRLIIDGIRYSKDDFEKEGISLNREKGAVQSNKQIRFDTNRDIVESEELSEEDGDLEEEQNGIAQERILVVDVDGTEKGNLQGKSSGAIPKKNTAPILTNRMTRRKKM